MNGEASGTSGVPGGGLRTAWLTIAGSLLFVDTINVFTVLDDAARLHRRLSAWEPVIWEGSSGIAELTVCGIIYLALRVARPGVTSWRRVLVVHAGASVAYSTTHVALMIGLRRAAYAIRGFQYLGPAEWLYEYRKDLVSYVLIGAIFWLCTRPARAASPAAVVEPPSLSPSSFDIVEGARMTRVPVSAIGAVRAAGELCRISPG